MTEHEVISGYIKTVGREKPANKIFPNVHLGRFECDILELTKSGYLYEYEIKLTKADFKNDAKKQTGTYVIVDGKYQSKPLFKYDHLSDGKRVNYFYYVVPEGLLKAEDVPEFAGLMEFKSGETVYSDGRAVPYFRFVTIKNAKKLSPSKISQERYIKLLESTYYRYHSLRAKIK